MIKKCIRPQCMKIYKETDARKFCACGTQLQNIETKPKSGEASESKILSLILDDGNIDFPLSDVTRIGRSVEGASVEIDLTKYAERDVSKKHAVVFKENDYYCITNTSKSRSVTIIHTDNSQTPLVYNQSTILKTGDGIVLSKKVLLEFKEGENK